MVPQRRLLSDEVKTVKAEVVKEEEEDVAKERKQHQTAHSGNEVRRKDNKYYLILPA